MRCHVSIPTINGWNRKVKTTLIFKVVNLDMVCTTRAAGSTLCSLLGIYAPHYHNHGPYEVSLSFIIPTATQAAPLHNLSLWHIPSLYTTPMRKTVVKIIHSHFNCNSPKDSPINFGWMNRWSETKSSIHRAHSRGLVTA